MPVPGEAGRSITLPPPNGVISKGDFDEGCLCLIAPFTDALGNFVRLAKAIADSAFLVSSHDQGTETETAAPFDDLGAAVDEDDLFGQLVAIGVRWNGGWLMSLITHGK